MIKSPNYFFSHIKVRRSRHKIRNSDTSEG